MGITKRRISEEQGGFRKGTECVDQTFAVRMTAEKYPAKGRTLYVAFNDSEKEYDRIHWSAMGNVLKIYGVEG